MTGAPFHSDDTWSVERVFSREEEILPLPLTEPLAKQPSGRSNCQSGRTTNCISGEGRIRRGHLHLEIGLHVVDQPRRQRHEPTNGLTECCNPRISSASVCVLFSFLLRNHAINYCNIVPSPAGRRPASQIAIPPARRPKPAKEPHVPESVFFGHDPNLCNKNTIKSLEYPQTGFTAALCDENRKQTKAAKIHEPECPAAPPGARNLRPPDGRQKTKKQPPRSGRTACPPNNRQEAAGCKTRAKPKPVILPSSRPNPGLRSAVPQAPYGLQNRPIFHLIASRFPQIRGFS